MQTTVTTTESSADASHPCRHAGLEYRIGGIMQCSIELCNCQCVWACKVEWGLIPIKQQCWLTVLNNSLNNRAATSNQKASKTDQEI